MPRSMRPTPSVSTDASNDASLFYPWRFDDPVSSLLDKYMPWLTPGELFSTHYFGVQACPHQGWKIHVSATPWSAAQVLERTIPILLEFGVSCKFVSTRIQLLRLNNGHYGNEQVGKFITAYPASEKQAVSLAVALHDTTNGLAGPRIRSDRPLRPQSLVHYRYGAFRRVSGLTASSSDVDSPDALGDLQDGAGRRFTDRREFGAHAQLLDVVDPFEASGVYVPIKSQNPPLAGRYLIVEVLGSSAYGGVYRAIDLGASPPRLCVIKEFWRDAGGDLYGRLAPDWGEREAEFLARRNNDPEFPTCFNRFKLDGNLFIVLEYIEGKSLAAEVAARENRGEIFSIDEIINTGKETARALSHLHGLDIVFRDFNPSNVIYISGGGCRLIDYGIVQEKDSDSKPPRLGTAEFCSPQQWAGGFPSPADDVFSWAAVMHAIICVSHTARNPSGTSAPFRHPVERLPARTLRPDLPESLATLIDRAGSYKVSERPPMLEVVRAFQGAENCPASMKIMSTSVPKPHTLLPAVSQPIDLACEIGDALCKSRIERDGGCCWSTRKELGGGFCSPDIYHGAAGVALYLAELGKATGEDRYIGVAKSAARWLAGPVWAAGRTNPGLYCGESGVGWFFVRLAELLEEPAYLLAAEFRARRLAGVSFESLDLIDGAAGYVVFLVRLAQATGKIEYLKEAEMVGELLINSARPVVSNGTGSYWSTNRNDFDVNGEALLGLAHGAAGIAFALSELAAVAGHERVRSVSCSTADLLVAEAQPDPQEGWNWRENLHGDAMRLQGQCHGAIGIAQFLLRLAQSHPHGEYLNAVRQAALTASREIRHRTLPGLCHGVAGDGSLFLDCFKFLGDEHFLYLAQKCGMTLQNFRDPSSPGEYLSAATSLSRPDLLAGDAGIGWFFLRLANPKAGGDPVLG